MSYMKRHLEELVEELSKKYGEPYGDVMDLYGEYGDLEEVEKKLQSTSRYPVYIFRCKMCGEIFYEPAVGLSMSGKIIMIHSGWEGPPSESRHGCEIKGFSYLSYGGKPPLTPLQGKAEFVGYGYITVVKEEKNDLDN